VVPLASPYVNSVLLLENISAVQTERLKNINKLAKAMNKLPFPAAARSKA
jgi:hypothetical protein